MTKHKAFLRVKAAVLVLFFVLSFATASAAELPFKVVTYNIGSGAGAEWRSRPIDFEGLASHILQQNPDVVVLQEVHDNYTQGRKPVIAQPAYWQSRLGMNGHFMPDYKAWSFWGYSLGRAGHMILSRWPIVQVDDDLRPRTDTGAIALGIGIEKFEDNKMSVVLDIRGRRVRVGAMHLGGNQRLLRYVEWLGRFPEPFILAGDANMEWPTLNGTDPILRTASAPLTTIPNSAVADQCGQIDWIMARKGALRTGEWDYGRINGQCVQGLTDHPLVWANIYFDQVSAASRISYGTQVRLRHVATNCRLHSHPYNYGHPGSSRQQQVTCFAGSDENDFWFVKGPFNDNKSYGYGQPIRHGDIIRLEHRQTERNLHSHAGIPSPVTRQQEVTAFGTGGIGDGGDNWRVEVVDGGIWDYNLRFRLIHVDTNHALHSHSGFSHPQWTRNQQEVTGFEARDENDLWIIVD